MPSRRRSSDNVAGAHKMFKRNPLMAKVVRAFTEVIKEYVAANPTKGVVLLRGLGTFKWVRRRIDNPILKDGFGTNFRLQLPYTDNQYGKKDFWDDKPETSILFDGRACRKERRRK